MIRMLERTWGSLVALAAGFIPAATRVLLGNRAL